MGPENVTCLLLWGRTGAILKRLARTARWRHPVLDKCIGQHITGIQRDDGGIEWTLGRSRGLSL